MLGFRHMLWPSDHEQDVAKHAIMFCGGPANSHRC